MSEDFTIATTLKRRVLSADKTRRLHDIKQSVLGKKYELSLVFIGDRRSKTLNRTYRGKNKPTNVLSFPLTQRAGEIFINVDQARREAKEQNTSFHDHIGHLFIHGCLHLKGMQHGATMDAAERRLLTRFVS